MDKLKIEIDAKLLKTLIDGARELPADYFIGQQLREIGEQAQKQTNKMMVEAAKRGKTVKLEESKHGVL